jgi:anti-sigma regulatory factor (Ser/Thr protein kinase)
MDRSQTRIRVTETTQVGEARRTASQLAERAGLGETDRGRVAIVVTELANNLVRHSAGGGEILLRALGGPNGAAGGVEILAIDRGPGMADVSVCLRDGYSTGGTSGTGLGAVRRMSNVFDLYSTQPTGTVALARVTATPSPEVEPRAMASGFEWGVVSLAVAGETACGDTWRVVAESGRLSILVADGLGHGPLAAAAAEAAGAAHDAAPFAGPSATIEAAHVRMHGTRGGAVAVTLLDARAGAAQFAGVGNIAGSIVSGADSRGLFSHNGTAGVQVRKIQQFDYPWPPAGMLVLHSDGLQSRWSLEAHPGVARRHPAVVAGLLYRDFARGRDDLTVAVVRAAANAA